jgi:hypothetical protein
VVEQCAKCGDMAQFMERAWGVGGQRELYRVVCKKHGHAAQWGYTEQEAIDEWNKHQKDLVVSAPYLFGTK